MSLDPLIPMNAIITKNSELLSSEIDNEIVMMNVETGKYYGMNSIGSEIWRLLDEPKELKDIHASLLSNFKVEKATCEIEVQSYLKHLLHEQGL